MIVDARMFFYFKKLCLGYDPKNINTDQYVYT